MPCSLRKCMPRVVRTIATSLMACCCIRCDEIAMALWSIFALVPARCLSDKFIIYLLQIGQKLNTDAIEENKRRAIQKDSADKGEYRSGGLNKLAMRRKNSQALLIDAADATPKADSMLAMTAQTPVGTIGAANEAFGFEDIAKATSEITRVHRAVDSRNIGFEFAEVVNNFGDHSSYGSAPNDLDENFSPFGKTNSFALHNPGSVSNDSMGTIDSSGGKSVTSIRIPLNEAPVTSGLQITTSGDGFGVKPPPKTFYDSKPGSPILPGSFADFDTSPDGKLPRSNSIYPGIVNCIFKSFLDLSLFCTCIKLFDQLLEGHVLTTQTSRIFQKEKGGRLSTLHLPVVAGVQDEQTDFQKKVRAKDVLLMNQLRSGLIPEQLLKKVPNSMNLVVLHLSHFGLGDELGKCLGAWYVLKITLIIYFSLPNQNKLLMYCFILVYQA